MIICDLYTTFGPWTLKYFDYNYIVYIQLLGTVNFNHRYGCQKCSVEGKYYNDFRTMSFGNINAIRRTDTMFRNREQPEHHKIDSMIEQLNIDMIESFTIADPLHLLELGIPT